jgi:archaemetzincin
MRLISGLALMCVAAMSQFSIAAAAFSPPTAAERQEALGDLTGVPADLRALLGPDDEFDLIPLPQRGDWLDTHTEAGQSFAAFLAHKPNRVDGMRRVLYVQPIGEFEDASSPELESISRYAAAFFQLEVKILPPYQPGIMEFTPRVNPSTKQVQVLSTDVLKFLAQRLPPDAFCLIGVTMRDLYPKPGWNYVFGQAALSRRVGVYSLARYDPDFFEEERPADWKRTLLRRSLKVLSHETGHMFGLWHCIYYDCAMNGSNHLAESDQRTVHLCPVCLRKLQYGGRFDAAKRTRDLATFFRDFGWLEDAAWYEKQLARIPNPKE